MKKSSNNSQNSFGPFGFFKHPVNALQNDQLCLMIEDHGAKGIGVYWCIVEFLCAMPGHCASKKSIINNLRRVRAHTKYVSTILHDYGLFECSIDGQVTCPLLGEYTQSYYETVNQHPRTASTRQHARNEAARSSARNEAARPNAQYEAARQKARFEEARQNYRARTQKNTAKSAQTAVVPTATASQFVQTESILKTQTADAAPVAAVPVAVPEVAAAAEAAPVAAVPEEAAAPSAAPSNESNHMLEKSVKILLNSNSYDDFNKNAENSCQDNLLNTEAVLPQARSGSGGDNNVPRDVDSGSAGDDSDPEDDDSNSPCNVNKNENESQPLYIENKKENKNNNFKKINNKKSFTEGLGEESATDAPAAENAPSTTFGPCATHQKAWKYWEECIDDMVKDQGWVELVGMHSGLKGDFFRLFPAMIQHFRNLIRMYGKEEMICSDYDARTFFSRCYREGAYVMKCFLKDIATIPAYGLVETKEENPYRFETVNPVTGARSYNGTPIPADAPPRPSSMASWHVALKKWR